MSNDEIGEELGVADEVVRAIIQGAVEPYFRFRNREGLIVTMPTVSAFRKRASRG